MRGTEAPAGRGGEPRARPDSEARWREITDRLRELCGAAGLDLVHPLQVRWYNQVVEEKLRVPDFDRPDALGILIGNTRNLWPPFVRALAKDPRLLAEENPLDTYVAEHVRGAIDVVRGRWDVRWAHDLERPLAVQRLAHLCGLAHLSSSYLNVHPTFGPWIALRALVIFDVGGPAEVPVAAPAVCDDCANACLPAFRRAVDGGRTIGELEAPGPDSWRSWVAVRDACPAGVAYRYGEEQLRYHYTKDRGVLLDAVRHAALDVP